MLYFGLIVNKYVQLTKNNLYSPNVDCGDHVVIINARHISLLGREWKFRLYFHHPGYNKVHKISIRMIFFPKLN